MPQTDDAERALAAKVFEEKLRVYEEYLRALCGAIEGGSISKEEKARLDLQNVFVALHCAPKRMAEASAAVKELVELAGNEKNGLKSAEKSGAHDILLDCLFRVAEALRKDLYGDGFALDDEPECKALQESKEQKKKLKDFAAIDFETANGHRSSVCSVGLVIVRDGEIADSFYSLIRPEPNYYASRNTEIHGLTKEATEDAPLFPQVWEKASELIGELPLVAHFSQFDEGCLKAAFDAYGMDYPGYAFYCTCRAARRAFGGLPNHKLPTVAAHCGYNLESHHHALADAEACAHIAMKIL